MQPGGGFTFGSQQPAPTAPAGGFTFGAQPAAPTAGSAFGAQPAPALGGQGAPTSAFTFGGTQATAAAPAAGTGGFTFGTPVSKPAGGLFGTAPAAAPAASGGLFGLAGQQPAAGAGTTSLFGGTAAAKPNGLFGSTTGTTGSLFGTQPGATTLFGNNTSAPAAASSFSFGTQPTTSLSGTQQQPSLLQAGQGQQPAPPKAPAEIMKESLERLHMAWDPKSPLCEFRAYFYNKVNPADIPRYQQPPNTDPSLLEQALRDNPDPSCMVPVLAVGFGDLQKRAEFQKQQCEAQRTILEAMKEQLHDIRRQHDLEAVAQFEQKRRRQMDLTQKCLKIMKEMHCMRMMGRSLTTEDEEFRTRTENVRSWQIQNSLRARLNDLWVQVQTAKASGYLGGLRHGSPTAPVMSYAVADQEQYEKVIKVYGEMSKGEKFLKQTLEQDSRDLEILLSDLSASLLRQRGPTVVTSSPAAVSAPSPSATPLPPSGLVASTFGKSAGLSTSQIMPAGLVPRIP